MVPSCGKWRAVTAEACQPRIACRPTELWVGPRGDKSQAALPSPDHADGNAAVHKLCWLAFAARLETERHDSQILAVIALASAVVDREFSLDRSFEQHAISARES